MAAADRPAWRIAGGDLSSPAVIALLRAHVDRAVAETGRGSAHALGLADLRRSDIRFWTIHAGDELVGCGALRALSGEHGEVKSMFTAEPWRGRGAGSAMLDHIVAAARRDGFARLSLETGSWDYFVPARALYAHHGFVPCAPFGDYRPDPNSLFLTRALNPA